MTIAEESSPNQKRLPAQPMAIPRLSRLISPDSNQLTLLGHLALAGSLLLGSLTINAWMFSFASSQEQDWLNFERVAKTWDDSNATVADVQATPAEKTRMVDQFMLIQARTVTHAKVMGLFYKLNFIALGTIGLAAGVGSISLFFISKGGWERANNALINVFIVATGLVIFHSNVIFVFKFEDNITLNGQLYSEYTELSNAVLSYWAIQPNTPNSLSPAEFILATDQRLAELGKVSLNFDVSRVGSLKQPFDAVIGSEEAD